MRRLPLCLLGAVHRLGNHRCIAPLVPGPPQQPSATWEWLGRRAYAVYIIHPPVLVGISLLLHRWVAPALAKFAVVGALACIATWLLADPLVRLPEVRRVV
jgi:peptidoglycan/LPS O-acetylase OafA/YrhL